jgi:hypothetical protein
MSYNVYSRLNITRNRHCPRIIVGDELVSTPELGLWVIGSLVDLEKVDIIHRHVLIGQISHILYDTNQHNFSPLLDKSNRILQSRRDPCDFQTTLSTETTCSSPNVLEQSKLEG